MYRHHSTESGTSKTIKRSVFMLYNLKFLNISVTGKIIFLKGKQKSPGRATGRSRRQPPTPGGREKVAQIDVCKANKQMHDKHKDQLPLLQGDQIAKRTEETHRQGTGQDQR